MDPNDKGEQQNPVLAKIRQCQTDYHCKAIVAAWGDLPTKAFGETVQDRRQNKIRIVQRKNEIARVINEDTKRGYIGDLTQIGNPRHPRAQAWAKFDGPNAR